MSSENLPHPWHRAEHSGTLVAELSDFAGKRPVYPDGKPINLHMWKRDMDASGEDIAGWTCTVGAQTYLVIND
jgi:hypothetical protein